MADRRRTVLLDAAGTLIRLAGGGVWAFEHAIAEVGSRIDAGAFGAALDAIFRREAQRAEARARRVGALLPSGTGAVAAAQQVEAAVGAPLAFDQESHRSHWTAIYREALMQSGHREAAKGPLPRLLTDAYDLPEAWEAYPDAPEALAEMRARGHRLAVVSNFSTALEPILEGLGLRDLVTAVFASAAVGREKPDPALYRAALDSLGVQPEDAVFVGDDLVNDVAIPRLLGIDAIWLRRTAEASREAGPPPAGWGALAAPHTAVSLLQATTLLDAAPTA